MTLVPLFDSLRHSDTLTMPAGWTQGRANYGGLVGALLYARMEKLLGAPRVLRSATVSFVGPVATGLVTLTAEVLREGKSVVQVEARMLQDGGVVAAMLASFGAARTSVLAVNSVPAPEFTPPDESLAMPYVAGITPDFIQHFDLRWAHGDLPFTHSPLAELGGWMRMKAARGALDYADLFLLIDAWPPALLPIVNGPAPGSSMTWTLEPLQLPPGKTAASWWQYLAKTDYAHEGYGHCGAQIWDDEGRLVAISRQTVVVFA
ncbi:MAG: tesB-like acyl-CoA thioesterase [Moraxellaceae bacterium]|jgi:acyl-CoA thioesterase|nr:tesB-like acyl-CoA thioesterase [Moraxellaceae bacterium]